MRSLAQTTPSCCRNSRFHVDYNLAFIGTDFLKKKRAPFDPEYMRELFDHSYAKGRQGYVWHKVPPIYEETLNP